MSTSLLDRHLEFLCGSLTEEESLTAIKTLTKIVQNALEHPGEEHYRQLSLTNKTFSSKVWKHVSAQEFMLAIGWVQIDGSVVLPSDDLLPDALVALTKVQSLLEVPNQTDVSPSALSAQPVPTSIPSSSTTTSSSSTLAEREAYQERRRKMKEQMKLVECEKKRIAEQIKADRRETDQRKSKASHSTRIAFGSQMTTFSDIGVDLNRGSG